MLRFGEVRIFEEVAVWVEVGTKMHFFVMLMLFLVGEDHGLVLDLKVAADTPEVFIHFLDFLHMLHR